MRERSKELVRSAKWEESGEVAESCIEREGGGKSILGPKSLREKSIKEKSIVSMRVRKANCKVKKKERNIE